MFQLIPMALVNILKYEYQKVHTHTRFHENYRSGTMPRKQVLA